MHKFLISKLPQSLLNYRMFGILNLNHNWFSFWFKQPFRKKNYRMFGILNMNSLQAAKSRLLLFRLHLCWSIQGFGKGLEQSFYPFYSFSLRSNSWTLFKTFGHLFIRISTTTFVPEAQGRAAAGISNDFLKFGWTVCSNVRLDFSLGYDCHGCGMGQQGPESFEVCWQAAV